jgi:hypothetical protein
MMNTAQSDMREARLPRLDAMATRIEQLEAQARSIHICKFYELAIKKSFGCRLRRCMLQPRKISCQIDGRRCRL